MLLAQMTCVENVHDQKKEGPVQTSPLKPLGITKFPRFCILVQLSWDTAIKNRFIPKFLTFLQANFCFCFNIYIYIYIFIYVAAKWGNLSIRPRKLASLGKNVNYLALGKQQKGHCLLY